MKIYKFLNIIMKIRYDLWLRFGGSYIVLNIYMNKYDDRLNR